MSDFVSSVKRTDRTVLFTVLYVVIQNNAKGTNKYL